MMFIFKHLFYRVSCLIVSADSVKTFVSTQNLGHELEVTSTESTCKLSNSPYMEPIKFVEWGLYILIS